MAILTSLSRPSPPPPLRHSPPTYRARRGDPIGEVTQRAVEKVMSELRQQLPYLPEEIVEDGDVEAKLILKEGFRGECFQYALCGLTEDQRSEAIDPLQRALAQAGLKLTAVDSGSLILIHQSTSSKGRALDHFARKIGISPTEVFKFGDSAGPMGNDRELLRDDKSFNVGAEPAVSVRAVNLGERGPDGVVDVLDWLDSQGTFPAAIAADFDKTLNRGETDPEHELDPRIAQKLVQYASEGAQIGIITGRGESFFADGLPPLYRAGLDDRSADNISVYLFNGARPIERDEWPEVKRDAHASA